MKHSRPIRTKSPENHFAVAKPTAASGSLNRYINVAQLGRSGDMIINNEYDVQATETHDKAKFENLKQTVVLRNMVVGIASSKK